VLAIPDVGKPFEVYSDASHLGLGCVLMEEKKTVVYVMSAYFCPHSVFNSRYLIEFMCLKSDLIDNSDN